MSVPIGAVFAGIQTHTHPKGKGWSNLVRGRKLESPRPSEGALLPKSATLDPYCREN